MNICFSDAAINLDIGRKLPTKIVPDGIDDPVTKAIEKYKCHPSIIKIHEQGFMLTAYNFLPISLLDVKNQIRYLARNLDTSKVYQISPKILKLNDTCPIVLSSEINRCMYTQ